MILSLRVIAQGFAGSLPKLAEQVMEDVVHGNPPRYIHGSNETAAHGGSTTGRLPK